MLWVDTLNTCCDTNVHLYDFSEHFMKLSMFYSESDACNDYFVVNLKAEVVFTCIFGVSTFTR